jgi:hypothetical protein
MSARDYFAHTRIITIATTTTDGREINTPIWGVLVNDVPYVRNGYGETSAWYGRVRRAGHAVFIDRGRRYQARIEPVHDELTKRLVDDAYAVKYRGQGTALRQILSHRVRDYTMRVLLDDA